MQDEGDPSRPYSPYVGGPFHPVTGEWLDTHPATPVAPFGILPPSQTDALLHLQMIAGLMFSDRWRDLPASPRLVPLLVGPTGSGKSWLIKRLGRELGVPVLRIAVGEWIPAGARLGSDQYAMHRILEFVTNNPRGILHIDEVDKLIRVGAQEWQTAICQEAFAVIDRVPVIGRQPWTDETRQKLREHILLIGSGTWQQIWAKRNIGFIPGNTSDDDANDIRRRIVRLNIIPPEILQRFSGRLLILPPYTASDFSDILQCLNQSNALHPPVTITPSLLSDAVASGRNMRFVEDLLVEHLIEHAPRPQPNQDTSEATKDDIPF